MGDQEDRIGMVYVHVSSGSLPQVGTYIQYALYKVQSNAHVLPDQQ